MGYTILYFVTFIIEFYKYLSFNSNTFGMIYMILNLIVLLISILTSINYSNKNIKLRVSKNFLLMFIILFGILILPKLTYIDESYKFIKYMNFYIYYIKGFFVILLLTLSSLELKFEKKRNYKIN